MSNIGENYAQALYGLATEENTAAPVLDQLKMLSDAFEKEPDFLRLLASPGVAKEERIRIVDNSFRDKVHPYVLNFLKLLTEKNHVRSFDVCVKAYVKQYNADNGILSVSAVSATELTAAQQEKLRAKLQTVTGKTIELQCRVDPSCIGGVRLDYDGKRVDGTVKSRLDAMRELLKQ